MATELQPGVYRVKLKPSLNNRLTKLVFDIHQLTGIGAVQDDPDSCIVILDGGGKYAVDESYESLVDRVFGIHNG